MFNYEVTPKPFVKWAGGKRTIVPAILDVMPIKPHEIKRYHEIFIGGGSFYFALHKHLKRAYLSDVNNHLTTTYRTIQNYPNELIVKLKEHQYKHSKDHYLAQRTAVYEDPIEIAARLIYLNKTCYNGLYRVNSDGIFNVPIGDYQNPNICDEDNIALVSNALRKAVIVKRDFAKCQPQEGDLIYCDPPYDQTYTGYSDKGFAKREQIRLRNACLKWVSKGIHVIISNNDTRFIRHLYREFKIFKVKARRYINSDGQGRGLTTELIIVGIPHG